MSVIVDLWVHHFVYFLARLVFAPLTFILSLFYPLKVLFQGKSADPKCILITGASSGIGEQLAVDYAKSGILLALTGRNTERLHSVAKECEKHGARVMSKVVDVTDAEGMESFINEVDEKLPIDLVIANAGITETTAKTKTIEESTRKLFNVNVQGVFNTVLPVIPLMKRRSGQMGRQQHICIVSSIASFMSPLGNSSVYSTTKVAVRQYAEGLRAELARDGIGVSAVCPGYVDSRMTAQNKFHMPLKVGPEVASKKIREGISYNVPYICFPAVLSGLGEAVQSIPAMIRHWMTQIGLLRALSLVYKSRKSGSKKE